MTTRSKPRFKAGCFVPVLLLLSGCNGDDNHVTCLPPVTSSLSYTYTGDITGTFSVEGEKPSYVQPSMTISDYTWATGGKLSEWGEDWLYVIGNLRFENPRDSRAALSFQIHIPDVGLGKYELPNRGMEILSLEYSDSWDGQVVFDFISGQVELTYYQCDRIMGTFFGELEGFSDGHIYNVSVTEGKFDVKLTPR